MIKTVCIVGAGPSGLVAAKTLLQGTFGGKFEVTIFDSQPRIGGLWPIKKDDAEGLVHPVMVANQSRHTMHFSDFAWEDDAPQLPRAWQVGQYLERYLKRYCQEAKLRLGCRVEKADLVSNTKDGQGGTDVWRVRTRSQGGSEEEHTFDYLLVGSGFFGEPVNPPQLRGQTFSIPVIHSSKYRDLQTLLAENAPGSGKILIVGGQMSGVEIAGTIASHLSSLQNSPGSSAIKAENYSIQHLVQRPTWVLPLTTSPKPSSKAPPFLPLDLSAYNIAKRPQPFENTQGHVAEDAARFVHGLYKDALGTNQEIFSKELAVKGDDLSKQPFLAVSDTYMEFVRSGYIAVQHGKLDSLSGRTVTTSSAGQTIDNVAAIVLATGFSASPSLSFLPSRVLQTLALSPGDLSNTVALAFHGTHHPDIPNLGFVGFYRSPYWGVMEMQARFVATLWSAGGISSPLLPPAVAAALKRDTSSERTIALRTDPRMSQFPMGDYPWLMQEFAEALGLERAPYANALPRLPPDNLEMDILIPARYPDRDLTVEQQSEVQQLLRQAEETVWASFREGRFTSRAVFRSLLGEWKLERNLVSRRPSHPSGHFSGTAKFLLRDGTKDGRDAAFKKMEANGDVGYEYLYVEEGDFKADNGMTFRASRRYVWRYDERNDKISVWFAQTDDQRRADYLFHEVEFQVPTDGKDSESWEATAGHLCIDDFYNVQYQFHFAAVNLTDWRLAYTVNGPQKDYTIDGVYTR